VAQQLAPLRASRYAFGAFLHIFQRLKAKLTVKGDKIPSIVTMERERGLRIARPLIAICAVFHGGHRRPDLFPYCASFEKPRADHANCMSGNYPRHATIERGRALGVARPRLPLHPSFQPPDCLLRDNFRSASLESGDSAICSWLFPYLPFIKEKRADHAIACQATTSACHYRKRTSPGSRAAPIAVTPWFSTPRLLLRHSFRSAAGVFVA